MKSSASDMIQRLIPFAVIVGIVAVQLYRAISAPPSSTLIVNADTANYLAALAQDNNPSLFSKDTLFRHPIYTQSIMYGSAFIYLKTMGFLIAITGNQVGLAHGYFQVLACGLYLICMYLLLAALLPDRWLALALAIVSSFPSSLIGSNAFWGMSLPAPDPLPFVATQLGIIFTILLGWLVVRRWLKHDGAWKLADSGFAVGIGALIGVGLYAVHSITCLALIEILTLCGVIQVWRRKIPMIGLVAFALGVAPFLFIRVVSGIGVVGTPISQAGIEMAVRLAQPWMIFPWHDRIRSYSILWQMSDAQIAGYLTGFYIVYAVTSAASLTLIFRDRSRTKLWRYVFVTAQAVYFLLAFWMGWVALLVLVYACRRISEGAEDSLDKNLLVLLVIAQIAGPLQQAVLYYVWDLTQANSLIGLLHETARFELVAYLPMYILVGRAIWDLILPLSQRWVQAVASGVLCLLVYFNLNSKSMPLTINGLWQIILIMVALILATRSFWRPEFGRLGRTPLSLRMTFALATILAGLAGGISYFWLTSQQLSSWAVVVLAGSSIALVAAACGQASSRRGFRLSTLLAVDLLCVGLVFIRYAPVTTVQGAPLTLGEALELAPEQRGSKTGKPSIEEDTDFLEMTDWVKAATPIDSLFYVVGYQTSFRYFAERSLLYGYSDFGMMAAEGGVDPVEVDELESTLNKNRQGHPGTMTTYLLAHGVDYVVATFDRPVDLETVAYQDSTYSPLKVYKNDTYVIYELVRDPPAIN